MSMPPRANSDKCRMWLTPTAQWLRNHTITGDPSLSSFQNKLLFLQIKHGPRCSEVQLLRNADINNSSIYHHSENRNEYSQALTQHFGNIHRKPKLQDKSASDKVSLNINSHFSLSSHSQTSSERRASAFYCFHCCMSKASCGTCSK